MNDYENSPRLRTNFYVIFLSVLTFQSSNQTQIRNYFTEFVQSNDILHSAYVSNDVGCNDEWSVNIAIVHRRRKCTRQNLQTES